MSEIDERGLEAFCEQYFCWWRLPDTTDEMREAQRVHIRPAIRAYEQHRGKQEPVAEIHSSTLRWLVPDDDARPTNAKLYASPQPADVGALRAVTKKLRDALDGLRPFPLVVEPVAAALIAEADAALATAGDHK